MQRVGGQFDTSNIKQIISDQNGSSNLYNNSEFRKYKLDKLGSNKNIKPTYLGGGFKNSDKFLLPEIESGKYNTAEMQKDMLTHEEYKKLNKWSDDFLNAI